MSFNITVEHENKALQNIINSDIIKEISTIEKIKFPDKENTNYKTRDVTLTFVLSILGGISSTITIAEIIYRYVSQKKATITIENDSENIKLTYKNINKDEVVNFLKNYVDKK